MKMKFGLLMSYAKTEGLHTFTVSGVNDSGRMMKLFGASRTYSHTAEPRNVKFASGIKDWPIKKSVDTIVDTTVTMTEEDQVVLLLPDFVASESFVNAQVTVNDVTLKYVLEHGVFENEEDTIEIFVEEDGLKLWAQEIGTYSVKIETSETVIAEDFKEAVEIAGSGEGGLPTPGRDGQIIYSKDRTWQVGIPNSEDADFGFMAPYFSPTESGPQYSKWRNIPTAPINSTTFTGIAIALYDNTLAPTYRDVSVPGNMFISNTLYLLLKNNSGQFVLKELRMPTGTGSQGTYVLKCIKSSDSAEGTLQWVKES